MTCPIPQYHTCTAPASWRNLPRKDQLAILTVCRVVDFIQIASFQTVCYYQLRSFDQSLTEETLAWQTGMAKASFTAGQFCTAIFWGYVADTRWVRRKKVLLLGLIGTGLSCIGLAFSRSFIMAVICRAFGGGINGTVGVVRTMISEVIRDRKYQSRAFLHLPASFSVAAIIGPVCAGWFSDPAKQYPTTLGSIKRLVKHPYASPALLSAIFLFSTSIVIGFLLEETLEVSKRGSDLGNRVVRLLCSSIGVMRRYSTREYDRIPNEEEVCLADNTAPTETTEKFIATPDRSQGSKHKLPFYRIWTSNVLLTMLAQALLDFHLGAFVSIWPVLLSSPRDSSLQLPHFSIEFRGGLGLELRDVGYAMAIMGIAGLALQILIYPTIHGRLGSLKCYRVFSLLFPLAYAGAPFLVTISEDSVGITRAVILLCIAVVLLVHVTGRIFVIPASITLLNNCSPHPSVLGIVHGIGQSNSGALRTIGPIFAGYLYKVGFSKGAISIVWWSISGFALVGWFASLFIQEGSGHEIILPGECDSEDTI